MSDWFTVFVGESESAPVATHVEESTWFSMLVGSETPTATASEVTATEVTEHDDSEIIQEPIAEPSAEPISEPVVEPTANLPTSSIDDFMAAENEDDGVEEIEFGAVGDQVNDVEGDEVSARHENAGEDADIGVTSQSTTTTGDTDDWFSKFEDGEKFDAEEEPSHWFDKPLEWITGRKSRGLTLELYEHEHHLMELAHEGVVVISEEGIQGAYEHLTHDALLAIAKAHVRFGIVEVHDYEELRPVSRSSSGRNLMRSKSGREFTRTDEELEEERKKLDAERIQKRKRMTTAEINAEAEAMVARWEAGGAGSGTGSGGIIPSWFYGHIERLGFVPASRVVKTEDGEEKTWFDDTEEGKAAKEPAFEKGHSVAMVDENHAKIPVDTEGTILLIKKDGTIMVNFAGYGVAPLTPYQIRKSSGEADAHAVDAFMKLAADDVDHIGEEEDEEEEKKEEDNWYSAGGGGGGEDVGKKKGFWKWMKKYRGSASNRDNVRTFGSASSSSSSNGMKPKKSRSFKETVKSISKSFSPRASRKSSSRNSFKTTDTREDDIDALNPNFESEADSPQKKRISSVSFHEDVKEATEEEDFDARRKEAEASAGISTSFEEEEDFDSKLRKKASLREQDGVKDDAADGNKELPYGGNLQEAMKAKDRDSIREIMKHNQGQAAATEGSTTKAASQEEDEEEEEGDTFGELPSFGASTDQAATKPHKSHHHHHHHYHHHHHHHKGEKKVKSRESVMLDEARESFNQGSMEGFELPGFGSAKRMTMGLFEFIESINPVKAEEEDEYYSDSCSSSSSGSESYSDSQSSDEETTF